MELFWHRRDLRLADNVGLAAAADRGEVAGVFVFDDDVLAHASDVRVRRLLDGLASLRDDYRDRDSDLLVARGDPATVLPELAESLDADRVVWNRDYSGLARERDAEVRKALNEAGIEREAHHDAVLHTPDSIRTNAGDPYSVYTYYWRKWTDRETDPPAPTPEPRDLVDADSLTAAADGDDGAFADGGVAADRVAVGDLPSPEELGFAEPDADVGPAGTEAARERLDAAIEKLLPTHMQMVMGIGDAEEIARAEVKAEDHITTNARPSAMALISTSVFMASGCPCRCAAGT